MLKCILTILFKKCPNIFFYTLAFNLCSRQRIGFKKMLYERERERDRERERGTERALFFSLDIN
jgi:hypothetical protein